MLALSSQGHARSTFKIPHTNCSRSPIKFRWLATRLPEVCLVFYLSVAVLNRVSSHRFGLLDYIPSKDTDLITSISAQLYRLFF